jgi:putative Mg2+ transporter-C (MgtC) family protein
MDWEPLGRIMFAAALAVFVGLEREFRGKPAGLRTHVVLATACAALGYLSIVAADGHLGADRTRIASYAISGIGFMGAGVIFAATGRVHGLTTAAALFSIAAMGLCVGMGSYGLGFALVLVTLVFLGPVDWLADRLIGERISNEHTIRILTNDVTSLSRVQDVIRSHGADVRSLELNQVGDAIGIRIILRCRHQTALDIVEQIEHLDGVSFVFDQ